MESVSVAPRIYVSSPFPALPLRFPALLSPPPYHTPVWNVTYPTATPLLWPRVSEISTLITPPLSVPSHKGRGDRRDYIMHSIRFSLGLFTPLYSRDIGIVADLTPFSPSGNDRKVPRFLNIWELAKQRPDLFVSLQNGYPILDPEISSFALPAIGFSTEDLPVEAIPDDSADDGNDTEEEDDAGQVAGPSTSIRSAAPGLQAHPSAFDSMAGLNRSLAGVSRTISKAPTLLGANPFMTINNNNNEAIECDDDNDATGSSSSSPIDPQVPQLLTHLTKVFRSIMLPTAAAMIHASEPDKSLGWNWSTLEHARALFQHRAGVLPFMDRRFKSQVTKLPTGWGAYVWARGPLQPCAEGEGDNARLRGFTTPVPRGVWIRGPGTQNEGHRVESREARLNYVDMAMATFVVPPTFGLTETDFVDMCQSQEFSDGARGEREFTPGDSVWATIHDVCKELGVKHFTVSTYESIAFGAFSSSFESAFISTPMSTHEPEDWNPARGPIMPSFPPHKRFPVEDQLSGKRQPNALQRLAYWMRTSMGDCAEGWNVPTEVDGSAGWSGAMMAVVQAGQPEETISYHTTEASATKEWVWKFLKPEVASISAHRDAHDFVERVIFANDNFLGRSYTIGQINQFGPLGGGRRSVFVGGAQGNSVLMEARHAQVAQRLDQIALEGGDGADAVPVIATTNELGKPLARMWVEGEDRLVEMAGDAFAWVRPGVEHDSVIAQQMSSKLVPVDDDQVSAAGIEDVEADGSQPQVVVAPEEDDMMAVEDVAALPEAPLDPAAILVNLQMQIPNAVLLPSTADGELPLIQNSVTGDLYRVFGNHVVHVGDGKNNRGVHFSEDDEDLTEPEDVFDEDEDKDVFGNIDTPATSFFGECPSSSPAPKPRRRPITTITLGDPIVTRARWNRPIREVVAPVFLTPTFPARTPKRRRSAKENAGHDDRDDSLEPEPIAKRLRWASGRQPTVALGGDSDNDDDDDVDMDRSGNRFGSSSAARGTPAPRRLASRPIKSLRSRKV
ncbi:hypothetical protein FRB95_009619 [Tulasnella sp. JGI-2019a]|nr:hypothetical protein FRB93_009027 [Tulasnella sp. JGI-2019a]KAG9025934.1 hypothetical protein FRB95_009619 [Tulasnella sp. JGI-2019a]